MDSEEAVNKWRTELTGYQKEMCKFKDEDDLELVYRKLSGYSARASRMRAIAAQNATVNKLIRFRIDEIEPFIAEIERQFKIFSRVQSLIQTEVELSR